MVQSPKRPARKASSPVKGKLESFIKRNVKEKEFQSVTIKKEALESVKKQPSRVSPNRKKVTPEAKKRVRRDKKDKIKILDIDTKDETMESPNPTPTLDKATIKVDSSNVYQYLLDTPTGKISKLGISHMHETIQAWKKYRGIAQIQDIKSVSEAFLHIEIEDIKTEAIREQQSNQLAIHLEKEHDIEMKQAKNVHLDAQSTIEDISKYDKDELVYYLSYHSKESVNINETMDLDHPVVVEKIAEFLNIKNTNNRNELTSVPGNTQTTQSKSTTKLISSLRSPKNKIADQKNAPIEITADLTDSEIHAATLEQLQSAFHLFSIKTGEEIQKTVVCEWSHEFITEICLNKRNSLLLKRRMMEQMPKNDEKSTKASSKKKKGKLVQTNLIQPNQTKNTCRYSLFFTTPANFKGTDGLREFLSLIFMEMIKYGEDICILPWATDEMTKPISTADALPNTITSLAKYFEGARSPESSTQMYLKIRLGYSISMKKDNFDADVQGWCKAQSIRMYQCAVQHPNVRTCGWLVYAPRTMNQQKWCLKVTQMYESKNVTKNQEPFQIGLTWRALNGQWEVDKKNKVRAMHIEAPVEIASRVKNFLRILAQHKKWPLNVRFRVMDEFNRYMKESTKQKYRYMVSKHTSLLNQLGVCECTQIINLDKKIESSQMTLRDVILNVRDKKDGYRVFGSIDEKWNSDTIFVATYRPDKSALAYDFVRSLSTYMTYLFPDASFKRILTPQALDKANDETYNSNSQTFTTQDDIDLDKEIQADLDDDSMNFAAPDDINDPFQFDESIRLVGGDSVWDLNGDDDTVSTNQPNGAGNVSFNSVACRLYDTNSCASSVNSTSSQVKQTPPMQERLVSELNKLAAPLSKTIQEDDSNEGDAEDK